MIGHEKNQYQFVSPVTLQEFDSRLSERLRKNLLIRQLRNNGYGKWFLNDVLLTHGKEKIHKINKSKEILL